MWINVIKRAGLMIFPPHQFIQTHCTSLLQLRIESTTMTKNNIKANGALVSKSIGIDIQIQGWGSEVK